MTRSIKNPRLAKKKHQRTKKAKQSLRTPRFVWSNSSDRVINTMKSFGCTSDDEGVCYGVACVAVHAMLLNQIDQFDEDLQLIKESPEYNAQDQLTQRTFFEAVELCHQPKYYPCLFPSYLKNQNSQPIQNIRISFPLIESQAISDQGGITIAARFSGVYSLSELAQCLQCIRAGLEKFPHPMALLLSDDGHIITIQFHPKEKVWFFVDLRSLPTIPFYDEGELARAIGNTLSPHLQHTVLSALMIVTKRHEEKAKNAFSTIQNTPSWKTFYKLNDSKNQYLKEWLFVSAFDGCKKEVSFLLTHHVNSNTTFDHISSLDIAVEQGHAAVVKVLLSHGAIVNRKNTNHSSLYYALRHGHERVAKILRTAGARLRREEYETLHISSI